MCGWVRIDTTIFFKEEMIYWITKTWSDVVKKNSICSVSTPSGTLVYKMKTKKITPASLLFPHPTPMQHYRLLLRRITNTASLFVSFDSHSIDGCDLLLYSRFRLCSFLRLMILCGFSNKLLNETRNIWKKNFFWYVKQLCNNSLIDGE